MNHDTYTDYLLYFTFNSQHCDSKMQQTLKLSIQFQINDEKISITLINKKQLTQSPFK